MGLVHNYHFFPASPAASVINQMDALKTKLNLTRFPGMSPMMAAIIGYVLSESFTDPAIAEITRIDDLKDRVHLTLGNSPPFPSAGGESEAPGADLLAVAALRTLVGLAFDDSITRHPRFPGIPQRGGVVSRQDLRYLHALGTRLAVATVGTVHLDIGPQRGTCGVICGKLIGGKSTHLGGIGDPQILCQLRRIVHAESSRLTPGSFHT